jgi:tRNA-dihydrouridine synthase A
LLDVDPELFGEVAPCATMKDVFEAMSSYIERQLAQGARLHAMTRHFVGAFHGVPGARAFRRHLAEKGVKPDATVQVLRDAVALVGQRAVERVAA